MNFKSNQKVIILSSLMLCWGSMSCEKEKLTPIENQMFEFSDNEQFNSNKNTVSTISGEEWFRSIIMVDGVVTPQIQALTNHGPLAHNVSSSELTDFRNFQQEVINEISANHPGFFDSFKSDMESKDPVTISSCLESSKPIVYEAIKEILTQDGFDLDQEMSNYVAVNKGNPGKGILVIQATTVEIALIYNPAKGIIVDLPVIWGPAISVPVVVAGGNLVQPGTLPSQMLAAQIANLP